jgi:sigma-B regulation protein RsbU (phosphoserine phosphatase)
MDNDRNDFRDLFENAPCGYLVTDGDRRVARVNSRFLEWTALELNDVLGKRLPDLLDIAGKIFFETHIAPQLRMHGAVTEIALNFTTASRQRLPVIANAFEVRDSGGSPLSIRLALIRAVDRRQYEQTLLDAKNRSETALQTERETAELREQFIAVLGHDLRNPLASLSAGIRILSRAEDRTEQDLSILQLMDRTVWRATNIINDVLDLARMRLGGEFSLHLATKPLEPILLQVVQELRSASPSSEIEFDYTINDPVHCDHSRIGQLASNLIGNALTHGAVQKPVCVRAFEKDGDVVLAVSNAGNPIPEAEKDRLFQPFFRGANRPSRNGLGLGLYICSQIAAAHGGRLDVHSDENATIFTFRMRKRL